MKKIETEGIGTLFISKFDETADSVCFYNENQELICECDISIVFDTADELGISEKAAYNRLVEAIKECNFPFEFEMVTGYSL